MKHREINIAVNLVITTIAFNIIFSMVTKGLFGEYFSLYQKNQLETLTIKSNEYPNSDSPNNQNNRFPNKIPANKESRRIKDSLEEKTEEEREGDSSILKAKKFYIFFNFFLKDSFGSTIPLIKANLFLRL